VLDEAEEQMRADPVNIAPGSANERLLLDELASARASVGSVGGAVATLSRSPLLAPLRFLQRRGRAT